MKKQTLIRLLRFVRPYSFFLVCSVLAAAASVAADLFVPVLAGKAIDCMIYGDSGSRENVIAFLLQILIVTACGAAAKYILSVCNNRMAFSVSRDLRNAAAKKIETLPLSYLDTNPVGDLTARVIADVDRLSDGLLMGFTQFFTGILTIIGTLGFMLAVHWQITVIVVCVTPLSLFAASFIAKRTYRYFQSQSAIRGAQTSQINESIEGLRVVQAFGHEDKSLDAFNETNEQLRRSSLLAVFFSSLTNPTTRFVNSIVYMGVGLAGSLFAAAGKITVGVLSVFLSYANQYTKPFNEISGVVTEMQNAIACAERLFRLLDAESETPDNPDAAVLQPETAEGRIELRHVRFGYTPERTLMHDLSGSARRGERIAIVGPTGCGKTTLINLLMRFYDVNGGSITFDDTDIRDITRASLRRSFGMVLQDTWLRSGTVAENIAYGKPDATPEEIRLAAKKAHAHSFIRRLPDGYDTVLTGDGGMLSQGQKQLLCIARVMLLEPSVLILDEATSSIDTMTERSIQQAFETMMQGRTSFVVAHRLSTILKSDCIWVMRDGNVVEQGTHKELLRAGGFYAQLYNSQFEQT